jgi:hypothetical protein
MGTTPKRKKAGRAFRPGAEWLEDRAVPATYGVPWGDPQHLTLSFVPDGTPIAGHTSSLFQTLDAQMPTATWQQAILQAFQTWAVQANINIGLTTDSGDPLGTPGLSQHDPRFGDIRVGAQAMAPEVLSISVPSESSLSGTWSGDVLLNTSDVFDPQHLDLSAVMLHEAGHVFGLDDGTDPNSPMFSNYRDNTRLTSADVAALRSLYGARGPDAYEGSSGNDSMSKATTIPFPSNYTGATPLAVFGDVSSNNDVDYYAVKPPSGYRGPITFRLQSAGISLLAPSLTVLDAKGNVLGQSQAASDFGDTVSFGLGQSDPNATYYLRVAGATQDVFGIGSYGLAVSFDATSTVGPAALDAFLRSDPGPLTQDAVAAALLDPQNALLSNVHHSDEPGSAPVLTTTPGYAPNTHYETIGSVSGPGDVAYYRVNAPNVSGNSGYVVTATVRAVGDNGVVPRLTVLDQNLSPVAAQVLANGDGTYTVQAAGLRSSHLFLEVQPDASSGRVAGNYALSATFGQAAADLTTFAGDNLGASGAQSYNLYVAESQLFQFLLSADAAGAQAGSAVQMSLMDANGNVVFSLSAGAGQTVSGDTLFLTPGTYTVRFSAAGPVPALSYQLLGESISDPIGPALADPTLAPQFMPPNPLPNVPPYLYPGNIPSPNPFLLVLMP